MQPCSHCYAGAELADETAVPHGFLWSTAQPALAWDVGNCSLLASQGDAYANNFAGAAGGIIFATDLASLKVACSADYNETQIMGASWTGTHQPPCSAWHGNQVGDTGYGPEMAFLPSSLSLDAPSWDSYASNGSNKLSFIIQVLDEAGTQVTPGELPHLPAQVLLKRVGGVCLSVCLSVCVSVGVSVSVSVCRHGQTACSCTLLRNHARRWGLKA